MKILFLLRYPRMGASSRLRTLQYFPDLNKNGFDVTVSSLFDEDYLVSIYKNKGRSPSKVFGLYAKRLLVLLKSKNYDLVWIEKEIFPHLPAAFERFLHWQKIPYIVDYDDAVFHNYDLSTNFFVRTFLGKKIDAVMRLSSCVIAGNAYLGERAKMAGARHVEFVPTVVDYQRYAPRRHTHLSRPVIGWIGSPSTQKYVVSIADALRKACQNHNARLMLVGANTDVLEKLAGIDVELVPWTEESEAELIQQMDIGIMPLPDGPWEKGKCGYKLIQYMACAVPTIASPVGVNVDIVNGSQSGLLADTLQEWEGALFELLESPQKREKMGCAGRLSVEKKYSLQAQAPVLLRILQSVIQKNN